MMTTALPAAYWRRNDMSNKTAAGLVAYAKAQLGKPYWWGTFGQTATAGLLAAKRQQYPDYYRDSDFANQLGQKVHDCCGLIKGYRWCDSPEGEPQYSVSQDVAVNGLFHQCRRTGNIDTMPDVPGVCVFRQDMGHVGVYIGGGKVIEAMGHRWGVVETNLRSRNWSLWGMPGWIDYEGASDIPDEPAEHLPEPETGAELKRPTYFYSVKLPLLKNGMTDNAIRAAQLILSGKGYNCGRADGEMGPCTVNAVKLFQAHAGILADGDIGGNTWRELMRGD